MAVSTIPTGYDKAIWGYKSGVSFNDIKNPGLYFCQNCTNTPLSAFNSWALEVISSGKDAKPDAETIVQIAKVPNHSGVELTRFYTNGSWTTWEQSGRTVAVSDDLSTVKYFPKPGSTSYGAFIVIGTYFGVGSTAVLCSVANGSLVNMINMFICISIIYSY